MNLLAHIFLSGDADQLLIGNFIADFIKGNRFEHLEPEMIRGIYLHRFIDSYTDRHPLVKQSARRLQPKFGKYYAGLTKIHGTTQTMSGILMFKHALGIPS